ncbi:MAG: YihY/virulence factor BrkB family protein [Mycobacteriaceae bacterium]
MTSSLPVRVRAACRRAERAAGEVHEHLGRRSRRFLLLTRRSAAEFIDDDCPQLAAAVSYHVLLSIFPLMIMVASLFGLFADRQSVRDNVVNGVTTYVPLSPSGQQSLGDLVGQLQGGVAAVGLIGLLGLFISASGMMTAVRRALTAAWDADTCRTFVRGKLLDLGLVVVAGIILTFSFALTIGVRLARSGSAGAADAFGPLGPLVEATGWLVGFFVPTLLAFALFSYLYSVVPAVDTRFVDIWPGALVGALGFQVLKEGFAFYLDHFANYNAIYGSLGAAAAFIFFVYLSANVFLFGAEVASERPWLPSGGDDPAR